jgi:hypothetical protein
MSLCYKTPTTSDHLITNRCMRKKGGVFSKSF